jgi:hypothetical protein
MVIIAVIIILIILILSNIGLAIYNKLSQPCLDAKEYFANATKLPDGVSANLGSITSGTDKYYVGFRRVESGKPGVIGITSWNTGYADPRNKNKEYFSKYNIDDDLDEIAEINSNNYTVKPSGITKEASDAISAMFPAASQKKEDTTKVVKENMGYYGQFEFEMEGIKAPIMKKACRVGRLASDNCRITEIEGYSST